MRRRSSLPAAAAAAAALAAGCGASSSDERPTITMDRAAAAEVARAQATAEGLESLGYQTRANKAWQSRQNGYETLKRERCRRQHPGSPCRIRHIRLLNR
jgi:ABC-type proline/glycine betaine transport system substrate-binding protein